MNMGLGDSDSLATVGGSILDVPGLGAAHATFAEGATGCTVIVAPQGAVAGVDVRGSAPGTRETDVLHPLNLVQHAHAIVLCGGSAFGLEAANGTMKALAERGIGLDVGVGVVPIVPAAVLFDLGLHPAHPTASMGYTATVEALSFTEPSDLPLPGGLAEGNVGAGCGATVAKVLGMGRAMKGGIGSASIRLPGGLVVAAIVAVNSVGDVWDWRSGTQLAGPRADDGTLLDSVACLARREGMHTARDAAARDTGAGAESDGQAGPVTDMAPGTNTTIAVVASNATLTKVQATKVAAMAHDGLARTIRPVHTMYDGDTIFALATGGVDASVDLVGALSADVLADAVVRAVKAAEGLQGASGAGGVNGVNAADGDPQGGASGANGAARAWGVPPQGLPAWRDLAKA